MSWRVGRRAAVGVSVRAWRVLVAALEWELLLVLVVLGQALLAATTKRMMARSM